MSGDSNQLVPQDRREDDGYGVSRFNALRHGLLSRYTILPWESEAEYNEVLSALVREHQPQGPTEEHLVEELAGILWRKRRLRLAEAAGFRHRLARTATFPGDAAKAAVTHIGPAAAGSEVAEAIRSTEEDTAQDAADLAEVEVRTRNATVALEAGGPDAYERARSALVNETREWWDDVLAGDVETNADEPYAPDAVGLRRFIEQKVCPWLAERRRQLKNRPLLRSQAHGEALDPDRLVSLARYEVHLDRKFERTLSMLIRLREMRRPAGPA